MAPSSADRVYLISPWRRAVLWIALGPFLLMGVGLWIWGTDEPSRTAGVALVALMSAMLAAWQWLVARTRLELNAQGVRLRQLGMNMEAPWSEIEAVRLVRGREGFVTRAPLGGKGAGRLAGLRGIGAYGAPLYDEVQQQFMSEQRWIPIEPFGWHLRNGALREDIARFAPDLPATSPALEAVPPRTTKRAGITLAVVLVIAAAVAVVLALAPEQNQDAIFTVVQALIAPFLLLRTAWSARNSFRARDVLLGVLFIAMTLVVAGWCVLVWGDLLELLA